ncbi:hypothetical protein CFC21_058642 [Triticum aestivum]|uniref:F-box domain-containing protein n=2 Tax=Triticum aestivum TaxID=4565 RepID=A0A9R1GPP2_WHEAT|nr:hypothetical protein CFC21_058642 [Triticum aestivum]
MADCISALPDDLLHHVLSFLPAHDAVRTCRLARRWRHLWKSAWALRVTGVKGCIDPERFFNFIDSLLLLRDPSAGLNSFELDLDYDDFNFDLFEFLQMPANELHVNTWIQHALTCGPLMRLVLCTEVPLELPNDPFISQHLTKLELRKVDVRSSTLDFSG